jgi:D-alanyl-D-alanine endopeptidase (penicillin-binding protein 7)
MLKSALGVIFLLILALFITPVALAENVSATAIHKKSTHKKATATKRRVKAPATRGAKGKRVRASVYLREKQVKKTVASHGRRKARQRRIARTYAIPAAPSVVSAGDLAGLNRTRDPLDLKSNVALVLDQSNSQVLFDKNSSVALPIASITKLMTAIVVVEARQDMNEVLDVTDDDIDRERNSASRLRVGSRLSRANMLHIALMSSENRAASALGRNYPGGLPAFVAAMNIKAKALGMDDTHYVEPTGLSSQNVSSARDLAKLVMAAYEYPIIREYSTDSKYVVDTGGHLLQYVNPNHLVSNPTWEIGLQKTGYIAEAGRCLVMLARIEGRSIVMVFLDSKGKLSRLGDAGRIRKWLEAAKPQKLLSAAETAAQS